MMSAHAFRYCTNPVSRGANIWPDDITRWPVSTSSEIQNNNKQIQNNN